MSKGQEPRQSRATTHFKFYSEKYLWGSTRSELSPDERAVWIDFLCLASLNYGEIECFSRDQLASQLFVDRELLDRSINKFIKFGKVKRKYFKKEKKEFFSIKKWDQYQADYLKKRPKKSSTYEEKPRIEKSQNPDAGNQPILEERIEEDNTLQNTISEENTELDSEDDDPFADIFPDESSSPSLHYQNSQSEVQEQFLSMLRDLDNYPYIKQNDQQFIETMIMKYPGIDHIAELEKKIAWWQANPGAMRNNPRQQLDDWLQKEFVYQNGRKQ